MGNASKLAAAAATAAVVGTAVQVACMRRKWLRHMARDDKLYAYASCCDAVESSAKPSAAEAPTQQERRRESAASSASDYVERTDSAEDVAEAAGRDGAESPLLPQAELSQSLSTRRGSEAVQPQSPVAAQQTAQPQQPQQPQRAPQRRTFLETCLRRQYNAKRGAEEWMPVVHHDAKVRGLATRGISFAWYMKLWVVIGRQYFVNMLRNVAVYAVKGPRQQSSEALYQIAINTAICAFMNDAGDLEFNDVIMPRCHRLGPLRPQETAEQLHYFDKMTFELDHEKEIVTRAVADGKVVTDPNEISSLMTLVIAGRGHTHVHWWCNAVEDAVDVWPLAQKSMEMTQYLNYLAVFGACDFLGISSDSLATLLHGNIVREGFPVHSESTRRVANKSRTHRMAAACRRALGAQLGWENMAKVEAIIAATVLHSADHYYLDKFAEMHGWSELLQGNNLTMRLTIVGPIGVFGRLLVRENLDDAVCATIYGCCRPIDADFADTALFIGPVS